jgi:hypothetical protein
MIFIVGSILIQILCIVHVIKTGRNQMWIMAIGFLSLIGCAAYVIAEILPGMGHNRHVRTARAQVTAMIDPERDLRQANDALALANTAANRISVADAYAALGQHFDALPYYREALNMVPGKDPRIRFRLAQSLFETGDSSGTLALLDELPPITSIGETDKRQLLRARALGELGRNTDASLIYEDIILRVPGEEARCRYAALLLKTNQDARARTILEEVEGRMKRLNRTQRIAESEMYDWAMGQLATLRGR